MTTTKDRLLVTYREIESKLDGSSGFCPQAIDVDEIAVLALVGAGLAKAEHEIEDHDRTLYKLLPLSVPTLPALLEAAKRHGEETEPDHEVGDLQDLLWACVAAMPDDLAAEVLVEWQDFLDEWGPK